MAPKPRRIAARPDPEDWMEDELLTLPEAAALFWPEGKPVSASSLRRCYRAGTLEVVLIARKLLTTKRAIYAMIEASRRKASA
ncbi:hypothetical protein [Bradyrhizobium sp. 153]|uniref:hypothetical protein n=1 Tax=Bradyrhizobium sp. 153 TaxID=2782627 RepID=UPI001FF8BECB|nr:hypothetical protein [Bradyrhizobium sp. 153]MCK1668989.1 hypothetical protein [Bradyrhizobium sp. 153]